MRIKCGVAGEGGLKNGVIVPGLVSHVTVLKLSRGGAHLHKVKQGRGGALDRSILIYQSAFTLTTHCLYCLKCAKHVRALM